MGAGVGWVLGQAQGDVAPAGLKLSDNTHKCSLLGKGGTRSHPPVLGPSFGAPAPSYQLEMGLAVSFPCH